MRRDFTEMPSGKFNLGEKKEEKMDFSALAVIYLLGVMSVAVITWGIAVATEKEKEGEEKTIVPPEGTKEKETVSFWIVTTVVLLWPLVAAIAVTSGLLVGIMIAGYVACHTPQVLQMVIKTFAKGFQSALG